MKSLKNSYVFTSKRITTSKLLRFWKAHSCVFT